MSSLVVYSTVLYCALLSAVLYCYLTAAKLCLEVLVLVREGAVEGILSWEDGEVRQRVPTIYNQRAKQEGVSHLALLSAACPMYLLAWF